MIEYVLEWLRRFVLKDTVHAEPDRSFPVLFEITPGAKIKLAFPFDLLMTSHDPPLRPDINTARFHQINQHERQESGNPRDPDTSKKPSFSTYHGPFPFFFFCLPCLPKSCCSGALISLICLLNKHKSNSSNLSTGTRRNGKLPHEKKLGLEP